MSKDKHLDKVLLSLASGNIPRGRLLRKCLPYLYKNIREDENLGYTWKIQDKETPEVLCRKISKMKSFLGKDVLTSNIEFIECFTDARTIHFFADHKDKKKIIEVFYPKVTIVKNQDFPHWGDFRKWRPPMKFDSIVMNPPFDGDLHLQMLDKAIDITKDDGNIVWVHPSNWLLAGNKGENTKKIYNELKVKVDKLKKKFILFNANNIFKIGMFMPCCITVIDKREKDRSAEVIDELQDKIFEYENIFRVNKFGDYPEYYSLLDKISFLAKNDNLENHKESTERRTLVAHPHYVNIAAIRGNVSMRDDDIMVSDDFYTIVTKDLIVENKNTKPLYFGFSDKTQADYFLSYLRTYFARFCLSLVKTNGNLHRGEMVLIPWLDFSQNWTDEALRQKFNITDNEWTFIKSVVPEYYQ